MEKEKYGEKFGDHILEQYKLYVETTNRVTDYRIRMNQFYLSLLSALLALLAFVIEKKTFPKGGIFIILSIALLGIMLCLTWYLNLESYRQLNSGKFSVIIDMEEYLPYKCFKDEWEKYLEKGKSDNYRRLTRIEKHIPIIMIIPYLILITYVFIN